MITFPRNAFSINNPHAFSKRTVIAINISKSIEKSKKLRFATFAAFLTALDFMAYYYYGLRVLILTLISIATSVIVDYICASLMKRKFDWSDQSPIMDALLLTLLMPASVSYIIMAFSSAFMVVVGKYAFGGNKNLIFNPVAVAYAFCSFNWSNILMRYPVPTPFGEVSLASTITDNLTHSFTYNFDNGSAGTFSLLDMLWGKLAGPMGTSCVLIIIICAVALYFFGDISTTVLFTGVAANVLLFVLFPQNASGWQAACYSLVTGSYMFVLVFMANDHRVLPKYELSRFLYGLTIAVLAFLLRRYTIIENGAVFALLIACVFTSEFDRLSEYLLKSLDDLNAKLASKHLEFKQKREERSAVVKTAGHSEQDAVKEKEEVSAT